MATIRKRTWTNKGGEHEAWIINYKDQNGTWRIKTFKTRKAADVARKKIEGDVDRGTHTPAYASPTVAEAAAAWIKQAESDGLERATVRQYWQHVAHIGPLLGRTKLSELSIARVKKFRNDLTEAGRSAAMVGKIVSSLGSILADAMESGTVSRNVVHEAALLRRRHGNRAQRLAKRHDAKIAEGVDYPTKDELRRMLAVDSPRYHVLLDFVISTGLRASELRALEWRHVDLDRVINGKPAPVIKVEQRADRWNQISSPKSASGRREIPIDRDAVMMLKEWRLRCPRKAGELVYVFPNQRGNVETLPSLHNRALLQIQRAAGLVAPDAKGPKYGMHAFRHVAISGWIEAGFSIKKVQTLAGHSTSAMTLDTYAHLWKSEADDSAAMAVAREKLLG